MELSRDAYCIDTETSANPTQTSCEYNFYHGFCLQSDTPSSTLCMFVIVWRLVWLCWALWSSGCTVSLIIQVQPSVYLWLSKGEFTIFNFACVALRPGVNVNAWCNVRIEKILFLCCIAKCIQINLDALVVATRRKQNNYCELTLRFSLVMLGFVVIRHRSDNPGSTVCVFVIVWGLVWLCWALWSSDIGLIIQVQPSVCLWLSEV